MGVTLHYRGKLKSPDLVAEITNEVMDICETNNWKYELFDESRFYKHKPGDNQLMQHLDELMDDDLDPVLLSQRKLPDIGLRGIMFNPHPDSEPIALLFNEKGVLNNIFTALFPEVQGKQALPWSFTKTQFAGPEIHAQIVHLLVYLGNKYFKKFKMEDDGGYYPDNNKEALMSRMGVINNAIGTLEDIFENSNFEGSPEEVIEQIQDALTRSLKDIEIQVLKMDLSGKKEDDNNDDEDDSKKKKKRKKDK